MTILKKRFETIASLLLIITGILGSIIAFADFAGWADKITGKGTTSLVLLTVGMLAISLGLERVIRFKELDEQLNRFEMLFASHLSCRYYEGHDEVYNIAIDLCARAQKQVRTFIVGRTAPERWTKAISAKLKASKEINKPIKLQATVAFNLSNLDRQFVETLENRLDIYKKNGVEHLTTIRILDSKLPLGFDLLIIDREHIFIGIPSAADEQFISRAIIFEGQSKIANDFADWYDHILTSTAINFNDLKKRVNGD